MPLLLRPVLAVAPQQLLRPAIIGIALVEVQVSDSKKAVVFYPFLPGYDPVAVKPPGAACMQVNVNAIQLIIISTGLRPDQDERLLSLEYMLVNGLVSRQQLGNLHHIALMVPYMQQALDLLTNWAAANGAPVAAPRIGRNRRWQLNRFDLNGARIELMEPFPMR